MESNSIHGQRTICLAHIESHGNLELVGAYTGNPGFQRIIQDIRSGRID